MKQLFRIGVTLLAPHMRAALQRRLELLRASHASAEAAANAVNDRFESEMGGAFGEMYFSMRGASSIVAENDSPMDSSIRNAHSATRRQSTMSDGDYEMLVARLQVVFEQLIEDWVDGFRVVIEEQEKDQCRLVRGLFQNLPKPVAATKSRWVTVGGTLPSTKRRLVPLPHLPPTPAASTKIQNPVLTLFSPQAAVQEVEEIEIVMDDDDTIIELELI